MRSVVIQLSMLWLIGGCSPLPKGYKLSEFSYDEKKHNSVIVSRVPDYGDGHADGCVVMREMRLSLKSLPEDRFQGEISDVVTRQPLEAVNVFIEFEGGDTQLKLNSDSLGKFTTVKETRIKKITVMAIGYRSLVVNMSKFIDL